MQATHPESGEALLLSDEGEVPLLFTENETNKERLFGGAESPAPMSRTGSMAIVVEGREAP